MKYEDHVDDLRGEQDEENENISGPTEQFILEDEVIEKNDDKEKQPLNPRQQFAPRKQLTGNCKVHDIDSPLVEVNFENIIYLNRER